VPHLNTIAHACLKDIPTRPLVRKAS